MTHYDIVRHSIKGYVMSRPQHVLCAFSLYEVKAGQTPPVQSQQFRSESLQTLLPL